MHGRLLLGQLEKVWSSRRWHTAKYPAFGFAKCSQGLLGGRAAGTAPRSQSTKGNGDFWPGVFTRLSTRI